jgi:exodeoxyribonuclease X
VKVLILDTESHDLKGTLIELAWQDLFTGETYNQRFNPGCKIKSGAMAVHHIIDADVENKPLHSTVSIPDDAACIIGHKVDYDLGVLERSGIDISRFKGICTLALARKAYPEFESHSLGALMYALFDQSYARDQLKNAHSALADVKMTAQILPKIVDKLGLNRSVKELYLASEQARIPTHMSFGKHKGLPLTDLPSDYVNWLLRQDDVDPYLRKALMH